MIQSNQLSPTDGSVYLYSSERLNDLTSDVTNFMADVSESFLASMATTATDLLPLFHKVINLSEDFAKSTSFKSGKTSAKTATSKDWPLTNAILNKHISVIIKKGRTIQQLSGLAV